MKTMLACAAAFAALATSAGAEIRYDRKLEAAVMERVAARIGDIRGGFAFGSAAIFINLPDPVVTGSVEMGQAAPATHIPAPRPAMRLTPAIESRVSRIVF